MSILIALLACIAPKTVKFEPVKGAICERRGDRVICTVNGSVGCSPIIAERKP